MDASTHNARMGRFLLIIAFIAFISLGLPDGLLGVAWPSMHVSFGVPVNSMGALVGGVVAGYVFSTVLSGKLVAWLGIGRLLAFSCFFTATALFGYTLVPVWWMTIVAGVIAGLGAGAIDAGLNNYISHYHRTLLFLLHAFFGIGTTLGPLIMNTALNLASWRQGYWVVATFQLVLGITFLVTANRWAVRDSAMDSESEKSKVPPAPLRQTIQQPVAWLGIVFFVLYTGIEASVGQWSYTLMTQGRNISPDTGALFIGLYWGSFTLGRVVSGLIVKVMSERRFLQLSMVGMVLGTFIVWWNGVEILSLLALPLIGFSVAPMFPSMIGSTQERIAPQHVANTIGFQIGAAGFGVGVIIGLVGYLVGIFGLSAIASFNLLAAISLFVVYELIQRVAHRG
jgi:fucose permease